MFRNIADPQFIKFGNKRDTDVKLNIRSGQLKLLGRVFEIFTTFCNFFLNGDISLHRQTVATFFEPSIARIVQAVMQQRKSASKPISVESKPSFYLILIFH